MKSELKALFCPKSVAVLGASRHRGTVGGELFHNLVRHGFNGPVYPVNPTAEYVQSVRAYANVGAIPGPVDLAVLTLPADGVVAALEECGKKGVKAAIVISAGFKEIGGVGAEREAELLEVAREHGIRVVGPNCLGVINTQAEVSLNATFADGFPEPGPVSFLSQSGALGVAVLDRAVQLGIGFSSFVSVGNRCDVSNSDLLEHWERDPHTGVVLMYIESFGDPKRFTKLARRMGRHKPIVAVKSGRTISGSRAAASHTGALAGTDAAVDALFEQAGVIRVTTIEELFDTGMLLASQPLPAGGRVAILTNAGGPGILAADACDHYGLELPELEAKTVSELRKFLPAEAITKNPVDMIASAGADAYERAVPVLLADPNVDSLLIIFVPPLMTAAREVARACARGASGSKKPVLSCFMGAHGFPLGLRPEREGEARIPSYAFPESAAKALARVTRYGAWRSVSDSPLPELTVAATDAVTRCRATRGNDWCGERETGELLDAYGIPVAKSAVVKSAEAAAEAAAQIGYPVVAKVVGVVHKSDIGGVILDRRDADEVREAYRELERRTAKAGVAFEGVQIQRQVSDGIEVVVGVTTDPTFGPLIMFGLGGIYVELLGDVAFRLHPLSEHDIASLIDAVSARQLLDGYRGAPPGDEAALKDLLRRVNQLVTDVPELEEMDLNPVKILEPGQGCVVVDARLRLR